MKILKLNGHVLLPVVCALLVSCGHSLPSKLERIPEGLSNPDLKVSGIYQDGWTSDKSTVTLQQPGGQQALSIRGTVPQIANPAFRTDLELLLDDKSVGHWNIGPGEFKLSAAVPPGAGARRVTVAFSKSQELPGGDGREVGARLTFMGFEPKGTNAGTSSDVVRGMNPQLGAGWGALETFHNENFRWIENDARFLLTGSASGNAVVSVLVEPGPGVGSKPFVLRVLDAEGRQVSAEPVDRRTTVKFILPVEAGKPNEFRLHVDGGGKPTPNDPRILNFRVFEIQAEPWKAGN